MLAFLQLLGAFVANLFWSRRQLEVKNLFLRHQLNIVLRDIVLRDRALLVWMSGQACSAYRASFSLTRSCAGIAQGFGPIGAGNHAVGQEGPELAVSCANSSNG